MDLTETLLVCAALLAALSAATFTLVIWLMRPQYRRGRRSFLASVGISPSAPSTRIPSLQDEGSSLAFHSPRTRSASEDESVADVAIGARVGGAEVYFSR